MLQKIREKTTGLIATVILGLIIIVMAFFGMESYLTQRVETWVAKVEAPPRWWPSAPSWWPVSLLWQREEIGADEFRERFEQVRQAERERQGEAFDPRAFNTPERKREVLDTMIDERVLRIAAAHAGVVASDAQVRSAIEGIEAFQVAGKFDPQRYRLVLASGFPPRTPQEFQELVRSDLQRSLIPRGIATSGFVTTREVERAMRLLGEMRDVSYVVLPAPAPDSGPVSAEEIERWYRSHQDAYRAPEQVTLEYVEIAAAALPQPAPADEATLRQRYEQERGKLAAPEQRLASHILVEVPQGADAAAQKAAEQEAQRLAQQARAPGADFAALARAHSDDVGSKAAGGDLGWIEKGVMPAAFEQALFAMRPGEVRGPVRTDAGWHVIQLREVKAAADVPFEQVRERLAQEQVEADRERVFNELSGRLVDLVYKNPTALAPAAREVGLEIRRAGPIARGQGEGVLAHPAVQRAAFSETLIQDGTVSDPIEVGDDHVVLIRVAQHTPASIRPLAQVREQVIAAVRADRARKLAVQTAEALVRRLREGGQTLEAMAVERQLSPVVVSGVRRGMPTPTAEANRAFFSVPAPAAGKVSAGHATLPDGSIAVFAVTKVTPADPAAASPQERMFVQMQLAQMLGAEDARAFVAAMRKRMQVKIAETRL